MIALPVAGLAGTGLIFQSMQGTTAETLTADLGQSQAHLQVVRDPDPGLTQNPTNPMDWRPTLDANGNPTKPYDDSKRVTPAAVLPAGTRIITVYSSAATVTTAHGVASLPVVEGTIWDSSLHGHYDVVAGRGPSTLNEIMVSRSALARLGVKVGDSTRLIGPIARTVTVVGILDDRTQPESTQALYGMNGTFNPTPPNDAFQQIDYYLPNTPLAWSQVKALNAQGITALSREVMANPPPMDGFAPSMSFSPLIPLIAAIAGFAAFEITLLAGAAFTVGARQQQRALATVASVGATRSTLVQIVTSSGLVLGLIGGSVGIALGIAGGALFMQLTSNGSATQYWGFHLSWLMMGGVLLFALVIGWAAALVPAIAASRVDVVAALRGARKPPKLNKRRPIVGAVILVAGIAMTIGAGILLVALTVSYTYNSENGLSWVIVIGMFLGPVLSQVGLIMCSALLLRGMSRLLSRFGMGARLGTRDALRNPGRSVPALAVIMTTIFAAVFAMTLMASLEATNRGNYRYSTAIGEVLVPITTYDAATGGTKPIAPPETIVGVLKESLQVREARVLSAVTGPGQMPTNSPHDALIPAPDIPPASLCPRLPLSPEYTSAANRAGTAAYNAAQSDWRCANNITTTLGGEGANLVVGTVDDLALVLGRQPSVAARAALAGGGMVSLYPSYVSNGKAAISWWTKEQWAGPPGTIGAVTPARTETLTAVVDQPAHPIEFGAFVSPATADSLGLKYAPTIVLASLKSMPSTAQNDELNKALGVLDNNPYGGYARVEQGPPAWSAALGWGLLGLSALIAIAASAVAIGLARFDGRQDDATLASVGAGTLVRRNFAFWQALVIAGTGAVLGAGTGLIPAIALSLAGSGNQLVIPWLQIVLGITVLPLAIAASNWLTSGRARILVRRTPIG
jgi:putative ABC transport system permease protein